MKCPHCGKETEKGERGGLVEDFDAFRAAYPRRQGGQRWPEAERNFVRLVRRGVGPHSLALKAREYALWCQATHKEPSFVMQAATFLGGGGGYMEDWSTETRFDTARRQLQEQP